ncbi:hypothetical protein M758_2G073800 [Ceratodon purpureus]|nr:hypothetical protein M758_2G073800 [Ceratodon purpureus]
MDQVIDNIEVDNIEVANSEVANNEEANKEVVISEVANSEEAKSEEANSEEAKSEVANGEEAKSEVAKSEEAKSEVANSEVANSEESPSSESAPAVVLSSNDDSLNSSVTEEEPVEVEVPPPETSSDDGFVHVDPSSTQKGEALKALSSIIKSEEEQANTDGDWVALSSPALKVHALDESTPPSDSSAENSVHADAAAQDQPRIISYDNVKITATNPAQDVDPTKRESYLSDAEFETLFGMSKAQFYALPKWKQSQRKLNLDLF